MPIRWPSCERLVIDLDTLPYVPARHQWPRGRQTDWIVLHSVEGATGRGAALRTAEYFRTVERVASAHYSVDPSAIVCSVKPVRKAAHAPGANEIGIGIEICGRAAWSRHRWLDIENTPMIDLTAHLVAALCRKFDIPADYLGRVIANRRGITTHGDVTRAMHVFGGHTDPGPDFPMDFLLHRVNAILGPQPPADEETDDMKHELLIDDRDGRVWEICGLEKRYIDSPAQLAALQDKWDLTLSIAPPWVIDTRKVHGGQAVGAPLIDPAVIAGMTASEIAKRLANG